MFLSGGGGGGGQEFSAVYRVLISRTYCKLELETRS